MSSEKLHIITSSVPAPPDFGGAIDVFYKMKALHQLGVKIIMHCFEYKRPASNELKNYCEEVYYYPRKTGWGSQFSFVPYIVNSRQCPDLLERLIKNDYPILYEGLHTIAYLGNPVLKGRKNWVRAHNIEHDYYNSLSHAENVIYKKLYYKLEAWKLKKYNSHLALADGIFAISQSDAEILVKTNSNTHLIPAFNGFSEVASITKKGDYLLYHGDLSVAENNRSAEFIIEVCKDLPYKLIIAGKDPQNQLINLVNQYPEFQLIENPNEDKMRQLIQNAGVILLPAKQKTGLRLKLLASLFMGQHCIASPEMVISTGLEKLCHLAENKEEWQQTIKLCMNTPFTQYHIQQRQEPLKTYRDIENAKEIVRLML
jgi:hypothetical protein